MTNRHKKSNGWSLALSIFLVALLTVLGVYTFWYLPNRTTSITSNTVTTPQYDPAQGDPEKNAPGEDFFDYVKSEAPEEERERVILASLFDLDSVKMNLYFGLSVYKEVDTKIEISSIYRARAATSYAALVWPENKLTKFIGVDNQVLAGSELETVTAGDAFLIIGTNQGQILAGISNIEVEGDVVTVTVQIEPKGLATGFAISGEKNNPQIEHALVATPDGFLNSWLLVSTRLPSESELNNLGLKTAAKEALWLMLHQDAPELWNDIVKSIETPGENHAYDLIAPFVRESFCLKLDSYQEELMTGGKSLDLLSCNDQVVIKVNLVATMPTGPEGQPGLEYMKLLKSGYFVQTPDSTYSVKP